MHAHGIEVFDGAHDDAIVVFVAHHLHLILFPAYQRLVDQQFIGGRQVQAAHTDFLKLFPVVGNTATRPAHGERGADDAGKTDLVQHLKRLLQAVGECRARCVQAYALHGLVEQLPVFGLVDSLLGSADHFHAVQIQNTFAGQVQGTVQGGLTAHSGQQGIRFFRLDNARHRAPLYRLDIGGIRHGRVGHDGGRIGIDQHNPVTLFAQGLAGLRTGIVKFTGLPDDNWAGAQNQDGLNVGSLRHTKSSFPSGRRPPAGLPAAGLLSIR